MVWTGDSKGHLLTIQSDTCLFKSEFQNLTAITPRQVSKCLHLWRMENWGLWDIFGLQLLCSIEFTTNGSLQSKSTWKGQLPTHARHSKTKTKLRKEINHKCHGHKGKTACQFLANFYTELPCNSWSRSLYTPLTFYWLKNWGGDGTWVSLLCLTF